MVCCIWNQGQNIRLESNTVDDKHLQKLFRWFSCFFFIFRLYLPGAVFLYCINIVSLLFQEVQYIQQDYILRKDPRQILKTDRVFFIMVVFSRAFSFFLLCFIFYDYIFLFHFLRFLSDRIQKNLGKAVSTNIRPLLLIYL